MDYGDTLFLLLGMLVAICAVLGIGAFISDVILPRILPRRWR